MSEQYFTRPNVQPVITNIGTTPEQRQMSTSEFKAKFDEMPEAIQQYIKETLLTELDAFKQEFMTHQAESANKHIHSSGGNKNDGYWIKYDNGVMECWITDFDIQSGSVADSQIQGFTIYRLTNTNRWLLPQVFRDNKYTITYSMGDTNLSILSFRVVEKTTSRVGIQLFSISELTAETPCLLNIRCIGYWK